jgi:shikimate dehydrogenase
VSGRAYAEVIGDPITHSKSPLIHSFWLAKLGIDAEYRACHVRSDELADYFAQRRRDREWRGCNVTMPHKTAAMACVDSLNPWADQVEAVNTVILADRHLVGFNTDVFGILSALPVDLMPPGSEVCILGTGGAARAAFAACRERDVSLVLSSSRKPEIGRELLERFEMGGSYGPLADAHNIRTAEVIINATPLGMTGGSPMPTAIFDHFRDPLPDAVVMDMVYSPLATEFLRAAAEAGCRTVDGLAMLIGQAAAAFELFFGQPAPREHDGELRALLTA